MTDLGFRILLTASAAVLVLAVIDVIRLIGAKNAAGARGGDAKQIGRARAGEPQGQPCAAATEARDADEPAALAIQSSAWPVLAAC